LRTSGELRHKPSTDIEHYLGDLLARSDAERWLIVNQGTAPSGIDSVSKEEPKDRMVCWDRSARTSSSGPAT
jgi:hypothetical protein